MSVFLRTLNKISQKFLKSLPLIITLGYTTIVLLVVLNRFWQFEAFYYDHGYYESTIWNISRFREPIIDHQVLGRVNIFADHFIPSLFILSPLYWLTERYETTLVALSIGAGLSVLVAYSIAKKLINNQLLIYSLLFAYMFYIGTQNAFTFLVHPTTMMFLPLMSLFWSIINDKIRLFYILLFFNLGFKEQTAALTLGLGFFLYFYKKEWRKHAVATVTISIVYALIVTKIIMPHFTPSGRFYYQPEWEKIITSLPSGVFHPIKIETTLASFATFGFLPIFSPTFLPVIAQDLLLRFVIGPQAGFRWDLGQYYNANLAVVLFIGSVLSISNLQKKKIMVRYLPIWGIGIIFVVTIFHRFIYHGALGLSYNLDFYRHTFRQDFMWDFINKIPKEGKIMTQNNLSVFFTHNNLYILSSCQRINEISPDVIAFDFRIGQNVNNWWPNTDYELKNLVTLLRGSQAYRIHYSDSHRYIFIKEPNQKSGLNCPK